MGLFHDQQFNLKVENELKSLRVDVDVLKEHSIKCDLTHERHDERSRRWDDVAKNLMESNALLSESNKMLAKSVTDMNLTLLKVVNVLDLENDAPAITLVKEMHTATRLNWRLFGWFVALTAGISAIIAAYQHIIG